VPPFKSTFGFGEEAQRVDAPGYRMDKKTEKWLISLIFGE